MFKNNRPNIVRIRKTSVKMLSLSVGAELNPANTEQRLMKNKTVNNRLSIMF